MQDFNSKNPLAESQLQRQLHTLTCTDPAKVDKHLDSLIETKDKLETRGITISDEIFVNIIASSVPRVFNPTISAMTVVAARMKTTITPQELIAAI